jgi:hypothetical protein
VDTKAIPTYIGVCLLTAAALTSRMPARGRRLGAGLGALSLLYGLATRQRRRQRWPEGGEGRPAQGPEFALPDSATTTPPHGDVLDEERFSPAHAGLQG